ncbi:MAG: HAMP domain-containing histidine kinase [Bacteroidales bacterium]|nr:HAMP domain-containing histidine kinase [Bacteroidales bacterium]
MKLVHKIALTLVVPLVVTLGVWGWLSYRTMASRIHADTDMILKEYSDNIISRMLSGAELPERFNGAYNTYYIQKVSPEYAEANPAVVYGDAEAYLRSQEDFASSRVRKQIFVDKDGQHFEIAVSLPTFEQDTLIEHVLWWTGILFLALLVTLWIVGVLVIDYNMRPFKAILKWIDEYTPGQGAQPVPSRTDVYEFRKLADSVQEAVDRFEHEYEERKIFIGNASHELQTPLAVCGNRLEMLLERPDLDEEMAEELVKLKRSLQHLIRLNKTMLLLAKIENDRFPDKVEVNIGNMFADSLEMHDEIYSYKGIASAIDRKGDFICMMNEQMASVLVGNLVKNAYVHSAKDASVHVEVSETGFIISNPGEVPLDKDRLFMRFYQPGGRKEGSTGLGLALAYTVCERNGLSLSYDFSDNRHIFHVILKNSR